MSEEMKNLNEQPEETVVENTEPQVEETPVEEPKVEHVEPKVEAKKPLDKKTIGIIAGVAAAVVALVIILVIALGGQKPAALNDYTLGMGVAFGDFKKDQFNATVATVVLDKDGKIVACRLDAVQNKYETNLSNNTYKFNILETKMELGDKYGMATSEWSSDNNGDGVIKEWYEQAKLFEAYVVGKTVAEVEALATKEVEAHFISADDSLLSAGCTIDITGFKEAIVKACKDEFKVSFQSAGTFTLGLAANSEDYGSSVKNSVAHIKMNVDLAASVVEDGKIVASLNDAMQPEIKINATGVVEGSASVGKGAENGLKTKRELKEAYGMATSDYSSDNNGDGKILEWYLQSAEFSKYVVGKTADEVKNLATKEAEGHFISADDTLLSAGCTIDIVGIKAVVAESVTNAR